MSIIEDAKQLFSKLENLDLETKVNLINEIRKILHQHSPFKNEPVDCVLWIKNDQVQANDYNPNAVAPPEMKLLEISISEDGYTQPIVSWVNNELYEVVDGFHRNRVGKECESVRQRIKDYLPITIINSDREDRGDRIAATIRHNRARGKHKIDAMSEIVLELKRRNWSDEKIGRELGMDPDEVLRLTQITGLAEMFADREFSEAWEVEQINENDSLDIEQEQYNERDYEPINKENIPSTWEDRTDKKSILRDKNRIYAQVLQNTDNGNWNWYVFAKPIQIGNGKDKETAKQNAIATMLQLLG